jgi:hypothetical protein
MPFSGMLRRVAVVFLRSLLRLIVTANVVPSSLILIALPMEAKHRSLKEPHGVTSEKTAFFIITAVKTSVAEAECFSYDVQSGVLYSS